MFFTLKLLFYPSKLVSPLIFIYIIYSLFNFQLATLHSSHLISLIILFYFYFFIFLSVGYSSFFSFSVDGRASRGKKINRNIMFLSRKHIFLFLLLDFFFSNMDILFWNVFNFTSFLLLFLFCILLSLFSFFCYLKITSFLCYFYFSR